MVKQVNSITNLLELQYSEIWKYVNPFSMFTNCKWLISETKTYIYAFTVKQFQEV